MQTLPTFLSGQKKATFASVIGVSPAQLSQYLSGYRRPSYEIMLKIEAATGGAVTVQSWAHVSANGPAPSAIQAHPKVNATKLSRKRRAG